VPPAEKGGAKSGHRPIAWRAHDQDPRAERSALSAGRSSPDSRPGCRYCRRARCPGARTPHLKAPRRQGLRRRRPARRDRRARCNTGDPQ
jgi:hypothetical protein